MILKQTDAVSASDQLTDAFFFRAMMDTTQDSIYIKDRDCRLLRVSRSMAKRLGFDDPDELTGMTDVDLFGDVFGQRTYIEERRIMESGEALVGVVESRPLGEAHVNWTLTSKTPLRDAAGAIVGLIGITREINELKRTELDLQHLATHDMLTGLPNRYLLMDRISQVLGPLQAGEGQLRGAVPGRGRLQGHQRRQRPRLRDLVMMAGRLVDNVRASDTVARVGGDEFVVVIEAVGRNEDATVVAAKIRERVARPMTIQGRRVRATISIGISFFPENGDDTEVLVRAADYAMYLAKRAGKDRWQTCPRACPASTRTS